MSDDTERDDTADPCVKCGDPTPPSLARTVKLTVGHTVHDRQRHCPSCFADWIDTYSTELGISPHDDLPENVQDDDVIEC